MINQKGQHGWRPDVADMHPIFMAKGPDFVRQREPLEPFPNVDLYPLCCHLLQINPAPNNGSLTVVQKYLGNYIKFLFFNFKLNSPTNGPGAANRNGRCLCRLHHWRRHLRHLLRILEVAPPNAD